MSERTSSARGILLPAAPPRARAARIFRCGREEDSEVRVSDAGGRRSCQPWRMPDSHPRFRSRSTGVWHQSADIAASDGAVFWCSFALKLVSRMCASFRSNRTTHRQLRRSTHARSALRYAPDALSYDPHHVVTCSTFSGRATWLLRGFQRP